MNSDDEILMQEDEDLLELQPGDEDLLLDFEDEAMDTGKVDLTSSGSRDRTGHEGQPSHPGPKPNPGNFDLRQLIPVPTESALEAQRHHEEVETEKRKLSAREERAKEVAREKKKKNRQRKRQAGKIASWGGRRVVTRGDSEPPSQQPNINEPQPGPSGLQQATYEVYEVPDDFDLYGDSGMIDADDYYDDYSEEENYEEMGFIARKNFERKQSKAVQLTGGRYSSLFPCLTTETLKPICHPDFEFYSSSRQMKLHAIRGRWALLDRSFRLRGIETLHQNHPLLETTIHRCRENITKINLVRKPHLTKFVEIRTERELIKEERQILDDLIEQVQKTSLIAVNTEGHDSKIGDHTRLMVSVGSIGGEVVFWADISLVDLRIKMMLRDTGITKLGVGMDQDLIRLEKAGILITNWVDVSNFRLALYPDVKGKGKGKGKSTFNFAAAMAFEDDPNPNPGLMRCGVSALAFDLAKSRFYPEDYKRTEFDKTWKWNRNFDEGRVPIEMLPHIIENIRIPFAYAILVVYYFAERRGYNVNVEPCVPIIHEACDVLRGRDPDILRKNVRQEYDYWMSYADIDERMTMMSYPAGCDEMNASRRALADRAESFLTPHQVLRAVKIVKARFFGSNAIELPDYQEISQKGLHILFFERCSNCAKKGHQYEDCPQPKVECDYPHDGEVYPDHSILTCPALYTFCDLCSSMGHQPKVHHHPDFLMPLRELRKRYFANIVRGAWTSLVFLSLDPETAVTISRRHWIFSFEGRYYRKSLLTRYNLGLPHAVPTVPHSQQRANVHEKVIGGVERDRRALFEQRIKATDLADITEVSKDFLQLKVVTAHFERKRRHRGRDDDRA